MTESLITELKTIKKKLFESDNNNYKTSYPDEYNYLDGLLESIDISKLDKQISSLANIESLIKNKIYYNSNIFIILDPNFKTKLGSNMINQSTFMKIITENLEYMAQYNNYSIYLKNKYDLSYDLRNDIISDELKRRKETLEKIIDVPEDNAKLLELFPGIRKTKYLFELFDFKLDDDLVMDSTKSHNMYISKLKDFIEGYSLSTNDDNIIDENKLIQNELWHKPVLNSPRDFKLELENEKTMTDFIQYFISPELRLIDFLLKENFINNNFKRKYIDYILSVYRCCVIGNNDDLLLFKNNSKYYDCCPYYRTTDCEPNSANKLCDKYNLGWSPTNNAIGIELAARRRIIFPYMIISDTLQSRYDTIDFNFDLNIGIIVLKILTENKTYKYHFYYMRIIRDKILDKITIGFFDYYNNRIHFKNSASAFLRGQLLESKWAIYKLLWYLSFRRIIPYTQKKECDIIVYKTNRKISIQGREDKDIYLLSIYNKDEIIMMYEHILTSIKKFSSNQLYDNLQKLIKTFITELDSYTILNRYRLFHVNKCNKLFVWEIDPVDRLFWSEWTDIKKCVDLYADKIPNIYGTISCIKSNLYISMDINLVSHNKLAFDKEYLSFKIGDILSDILVHPYDEYFPIKYYYKAIDYNNNSRYKNAVDNYKEKLNRLYFKIYFKFKNYSYRDEDAPLSYNKEHYSIIKGDSITTLKNLKHYYKVLQYYNDNEYKSIVDNYIEEANINFKLSSNKSIAYDGLSVLIPSTNRLKYLKYKQKYFKLKLYIDNI